MRVLFRPEVATAFCAWIASYWTSPRLARARRQSAGSPTHADGRSLTRQLAVVAALALAVLALLTRGAGGPGAAAAVPLRP